MQRSVFLAALAALFALNGHTICAADRPGQVFHILVKDLPKPYATPGVDNSSQRVPRPTGTLPEVPAGFSVSLYASGLSDPRWMAVAPNGDVFLAEPRLGRITLLRDTNGKVEAHDFADGFSTPHGLVFTKGSLYVGDLKAVWKLSYTDGATRAGANASPRRVISVRADMSRAISRWIPRALSISALGARAMSERTGRRARLCRPFSPTGR
jgi:glucose/arabinose dehydrogenase